MHKLIAALGLLPLPAFAHPGEHHLGVMASLAHFVTQADHLPLLLTAIAVGLLIARKLSRQ